MAAVELRGVQFVKADKCVALLGEFTIHVQYMK